jgi:hypothetical protein
MMVIYFCVSAQANEAFYRFVPPLRFAHVSEIGNWTIIGAASNQNTHIRSMSSIQIVRQCLSAQFRDLSAQNQLGILGNSARGE